MNSRLSVLRIFWRAFGRGLGILAAPGRLCSPWVGYGTRRPGMLVRRIMGEWSEARGACAIGTGRLMLARLRAGSVPGTVAVDRVRNAADSLGSLVAAAVRTVAASVLLLWAVVRAVPPAAGGFVSGFVSAWVTESPGRPWPGLASFWRVPFRGLAAELMNLEGHSVAVVRTIAEGVSLDSDPREAGAEIGIAAAFGAYSVWCAVRLVACAALHVAERAARVPCPAQWNAAAEKAARYALRDRDGCASVAVLIAVGLVAAALLGLVAGADGTGAGAAQGLAAALAAQVRP